MKRLYLKEYDQRIDALTDFLTQSIRHVDGNVGWHQHLNTRKVGIVATSMALLYYKSLGKSCLEQDECIKFLKDSVKPDGGWSYISNANSYSNVESTCWAISALSEYPDHNTTTYIENGINWILRQHPEGNNDAGFPFVKGSQTRVYITSLVLRTLQSLGKTDIPEFESAKQWLINSQNSDGGWGSVPGDGSSLFFTSHCISTLSRMPEKDDLILGYAIDWLNARLAKSDPNDASLICYLEFIENKRGESRDRISFFHYVLPHVVDALINMKCFNRYLFNGVYILFQRCKNGRIEHPDLENSKIYPIWALHDSGIALNNFRKQLGEKWDYVLVSIFNRIIGFGKWNPIRLITFIGRWMWSGLIVFAIVFLIAFFWDQISAVLPNTDSDLKSIIISFIASVVYGLLLWTVHFIYKKMSVL